MPYDRIQEVRSRLAEVAPHFVRYGVVESANFLKEADAIVNFFPTKFVQHFFAAVLLILVIFLSGRQSEFKCGRTAAAPN